jgi:thymidylate kinase
MTSIALIGGDGAGKTTITRRLLDSDLLPFRHLYMGINLESSNVSLPGARWLVSRKARAGDEAGDGGTPPRRKGALRAGLRLLYRIAEEWYRQLLSWSHQLRGDVVLYDRHFLFDFTVSPERRRALRLSDRIHLWHLERLYPRPSLTILLDAPPEVLMARKGEASLEFLDERREAMLALGRNQPGFVRVDATQPLETVYAQVAERIRTFHARRNPSPRPRCAER